MRTHKNHLISMQYVNLSCARRTLLTELVIFGELVLPQSAQWV
jgi:hypothetical protein